MSTPTTRDGDRLRAHGLACRRSRPHWRHALGCATSLLTDSDSHRLGNLVSSWWFGSQPWESRALSLHLRSAVAQTLAPRQCPQPPNLCFGKYIAARLDVGVRVLPHSRLSQVEAALVLRDEEGSSGLTLATPEPIYSIKVLRLALEDFGSDLRAQMLAYADDLGIPSPAPLPQKRRARHCVIHYRVGDFLTVPGGGGLVISPESVADAAASFRPRPRSLELIDGGVQHATTCV